MNALMNYIQMVLTDMKEKVIQKNIYNVDILIHTLTLLQTIILFWVVVKISEI